MTIREKLQNALKDAMRAKEADRLSTLRLINAAIKDRDIAARGEGEDVVSDADITAVLGRMVKQRQESARVYDEGGRTDLAARERSEIRIVEEFLPRQLSKAEVDAAVDEAIAATGASSLRDMGRVMAHLKANHAGQMDFGAAGAQLKARLG